MGKYLLFMLAAMAAGVFLDQILFAKSPSLSENRYLQQNESAITEYGDELDIEFHEGHQIPDETEQDVSSVSSDDSSLAPLPSDRFTSSLKKSKASSLSPPLPKKARSHGDKSKPKRPSKTKSK